MIFTLIFTDQYNKRAARFLKRHPDLEKQYLKTLQLLEMNPQHPSLRLHPKGYIRFPSIFLTASRWNS